MYWYVAKGEQMRNGLNNGQEIRYMVCGAPCSVLSGQPKVACLWYELQTQKWLGYLDLYWGMFLIDGAFTH